MTWFFNILIRHLQRGIHEMPSQLSREEEDGLLSQLWQNVAFRKWIADRDKKLVYTMSGGEGMAPEPRDKYHLHAGQRVENLLLARDAKAAYNRVVKRKSADVKPQ